MEVASSSVPALEPPALEAATLSSGAEPGITLRVLAAPFTVAKLDPSSRRQRKAAAALFAAALDGHADSGPHAGGLPFVSDDCGGGLGSSSGGPVFVAATSAEISVVAPSRALAHLSDGSFDHERTPPVLDGGWRCLEVAGPMAFTVVGVMARLSGCLAAASVSLLAQSTYDTDYLCVTADKLHTAAQALRRDGHWVQ
jgi:hypothetical protein